MTETNDKNTDFFPQITKIGKAKDLISLIPDVEGKNSQAAQDNFSVFTTT